MDQGSRTDWSWWTDQKTLWHEHSVWLVGRIISRTFGNGQRKGRGRGTDVVSCASQSAESQTVKSLLLQRKQKTRINPVWPRLIRGYPKVHSWQVESSRQSYHTHYETWEMWVTEFHEWLWKAVLFQGWMETTGATNNCVRSTAFQPQESWGLGNRTPKTQESFWNDCK